MATNSNGGDGNKNNKKEPNQKRNLFSGCGFLPRKHSNDTSKRPKSMQFEDSTQSKSKTLINFRDKSKSNQQQQRPHSIAITTTNKTDSNTIKMDVQNQNDENFHGIVQQRREKDIFDRDHVKYDVPTGAHRVNVEAIDSVRKLPQYSTLQQLLAHQMNQNKSASMAPSSGRKMPIMKLTKDDWNVRCWEERIAQRRNKELTAISSQNFNKSHSNENKNKNKNNSQQQNENLRRPKRQTEEIFRGRVEQITEKLAKTRPGACLSDDNDILIVTKKYHQKPLGHNVYNSNDQTNHQNQGEWINMIRQELQERRQQSQSKVKGQFQLKTRKVGRLFDDSDDSDNDQSNQNKATSLPPISSN